MRFRRSAFCSAGPPLRFAIFTELTLPLALACALTEQIISSRQPLPTRVFETPRTYFACVFPDFAEAERVGCPAGVLCVGRIEQLGRALGADECGARDHGREQPLLGEGGGRP